jgi:hypothetical protein
MMGVVLFILPFALVALLAANVIHDRYESAIWIAVLALSMWIGFHYEPQFRQAIRPSNYQSYIDYRNEYTHQNNPQYRYQYVGDNMYEKVRVNY